MHWLGYNDAVSWLNKAKQIFQPTANFENFVFRLPACQSAVRPGCTRCRAPEISHDKGNDSGFIKMLFRRRFTHCTMAIPSILFSSSLFFFTVWLQISEGANFRDCCTFFLKQNFRDKNFVNET